MNKFDLAISFVWEFDIDFVNQIEKILQSKGLLTYIITKWNINETIEKVSNKELGFYAYLDRASDADPEFVPLTKILSRKKTYLINPLKQAERYINKAIMHNILLRNRVPVPYTIILPPLQKKVDSLISLKDMEYLGQPFVIKPAFFTGGGDGVIINAMSLFDVIHERGRNATDSYLIQKRIYPKYLDGKRAWFRILWAFDHVIPFWWDDQTDIYQIMTVEDIIKYRLNKLILLTQKIARISNLDYFSTEIAFSEDESLYVIDYLNDQCDMRFKSKHFDGVPDEEVDHFIERLYYKVVKVKKAYHLQ
ncbi:MAG: hypothetical protein V1773_14190 [bacterium]